jgi:tRNA A37 threonylcarbamoyladenosine dehydratase
MKSRGRIKLTTGRRALFRITESARRELQELVFQRHPSREWGSFFRFGFRRTSWGVAISFVESLPPHSGDLNRGSDIVSFSPSYIDRALDELASTKLGMGVIHSHPAGCEVYPSGLDDDMDHYFGTDLFPSFAPGRPYISLIVNLTDNRELVFSGRVYLDGEWLAVDTVFSGGDRLVKIGSRMDERRPGKLDPNITAILQRWISVVGEKKAQDLRNFVFGVVGCSGTGSPVVEALARAQAGEFVLIDPDILSISNIERLHGSCVADLEGNVPPHKVQLMARLVRQVNPEAKLTLIVGNSLDPLSMDHLLRCDVILFCTDSVHGRVHAGDLASRFLIPVIDVGVLPEGRGGRIISQMIEIMRLSPEDPCGFCRGRIDSLELHRELLSPTEVARAKKEADEAARRGDRADTYWKDNGPQLPSVGYLTTCAGALAAGYALNWVLGTSEIPHDHFQMDVGRANFGFVPIDSEANLKCACQQFRGHSDQGELSIYMPPHFAPADEIGEIETSKENIPSNTWWRRLLKIVAR